MMKSERSTPTAIFIFCLFIVLVSACAPELATTTPVLTSTPPPTSPVALPQTLTATFHQEFTPTAPPASITNTPPQEATATPYSITPEEYHVYDAVIESLFLFEGVELIVILEHTAAGISPSVSLEEQSKYIRENMAETLQAETLDKFVTRNGQSHQVEDRFSLDVPVSLLSGDEFEEIFSSENGWLRFYEAYPNSQGTMTLSRVGFNAEQNQALMYVGNQVDYIAGEGDYVLFSKKGGEWLIEQIVLAWIS